MAVILDYATPELADRAKSRLVTAAIACGATGLVGGLAIMGMWLVTASFEVAILGVLWLYIGTSLAGSGGICLVVHWVRRRKVERWWPLPKRERKAVLLLLGGFPAAFACVACAIWLMDHVERYNPHFLDAF